MAYDPNTNRWANSGYWEQPTAATKLAMCAAFLTELTDAITSRFAGQNESVDPTVLQQTRESVLADRKILQREADAENGIGLPTQIATVTRDFGDFGRRV